MASVYKKSDSPFWYARIWDARARDWVSKKTDFRRLDTASKRRAILWANAQERVAIADRPLLNQEAWEAWVIPWLTQTFNYNRLTLQRYLNAWAPLLQFFNEQGILSPRQLMYRHAGEYMAWRTAQTRRRGTLINHNTAVVELKVMSRIMAEAVRREYCDGNPFYQLGIKRKNVKHTPEMSLGEIEIARKALVRYPEWMRVSFEIALHHGVRLSETAVSMDWIHLDPRTTATQNFDRVTFRCKGKNGVPVIRTVPLNPALRPLVQSLRDRGALVTCVLPKMAAKEWWKFRRDEGLAHLRFHSTRATVATNLARANVPIQKAKELLGHSSEAVHLAYLRLNAADVADAMSTIQYATPSAPGILDVPTPTPQTVPSSCSDRKTGTRGDRRKSA